MDHKTERAPDTELNLTPMIDVVFQLIIFFMLTLKFKDIDRQIDANLPADRGISNVPVDPEKESRIVLALFREGYVPGKADAATNGVTKVRIDRSHELRLPAGVEPKSRAAEDIAGALRQRLAQGSDARAVIRVRTPHDARVPHADVMVVLDACLQAGLSDVTFEGTLKP